MTSPPTRWGPEGRAAEDYLFPAVLNGVKRVALEVLTVKGDFRERRASRKEGLEF